MSSAVPLRDFSNPFSTPLALAAFHSSSIGTMRFPSVQFAAPDVPIDYSQATFSLARLNARNISSFKRTIFEMRVGLFDLIGDKDEPLYPIHATNDTCQFSYDASSQAFELYLENMRKITMIFPFIDPWKITFKLSHPTAWGQANHIVFCDKVGNEETIGNIFEFNLAPERVSALKTRLRLRPDAPLYEAGLALADLITASDIYNRGNIEMERPFDDPVTARIQEEQLSELARAIEAYAADDSPENVKPPLSINSTPPNIQGLSTIRLVKGRPKDFFLNSHMSDAQKAFYFGKFNITSYGSSAFSVEGNEEGSSPSLFLHLDAENSAAIPLIPPGIQFLFSE